MGSTRNPDARSKQSIRRCAREKLKNQSHLLHPPLSDLFVSESLLSGWLLLLRRNSLEHFLLERAVVLHLRTYQMEWSMGVDSCSRSVSIAKAVVNNLEDAHEQIDTAISTCLKESKPVYIRISYNLAASPHLTFSREPVPFCIAPKVSNQMGLEAVVEATTEFLNKAVKLVMVAGPKLRMAKAQDAFVELADACNYPLAVMPSAKGLVPEHHPSL